MRLDDETDGVHIWRSRVTVRRATMMEGGRMAGMSRRSFIGLSGSAVASASLAACGAQGGTAQPAVVASETEEVPEAEPERATESYGPREDDASGFVLLTDVVPDAMLDIRYYSTFNFVGERIDGYEQPVALVTREAAEALRIASDIVMDQGYRLKIYDAYRPQMAVDHFIRWGQDPSDTRTKQYFYPDLDKSQVFPLGYVAERSGHSRGSTLDLTLFDMTAGRDLDMGGTFDLFSEVSHPDYEYIAQSQYANRMILRGAMREAGFESLPLEWWHFVLADEPYPYTYFTFPSSTDALA